MSIYLKSLIRTDFYCTLLPPFSTHTHITYAHSRSYSTCTTYTDDICTPFIYGEIDIYVNTSVASQELVEDAFRAIDAIPGQQDDSRLEQCAVLAKAMACHSVFPYCDPSSLADVS